MAGGSPPRRQEIEGFCTGKCNFLSKVPLITPKRKGL